jgi:hypothetical protein
MLRQKEIQTYKASPFVKILYIKRARFVFALPHYTVGSNLNQPTVTTTSFMQGNFCWDYHHWIAYLNPQKLITEKTFQTRRVLALRNYPVVYLLNNYKTHETTAARRVKKSSVLCRSWPSITCLTEGSLMNSFWEVRIIITSLTG